MKLHSLGRGAGSSTWTRTELKKIADYPKNVSDMLYARVVPEVVVLMRRCVISIYTIYAHWGDFLGHKDLT